MAHCTAYVEVYVITAKCLLPIENNWKKTAKTAACVIMAMAWEHSYRRIWQNILMANCLHRLMISTNTPIVALNSVHAILSTHWFKNFWITWMNLFRIARVDIQRVGVHYCNNQSLQAVHLAHHLNGTASVQAKCYHMFWNLKCSVILYFC